MLPRVLISDFDGVIADRETLACGIAAAYATDLGAAMTAREGLDAFMGKRVADVEALIIQRGKPFPDLFCTRPASLAVRRRRRWLSKTAWEASPRQSPPACR